MKFQHTNAQFKRNLMRNNTVLVKVNRFEVPNL